MALSIGNQHLIEARDHMMRNWERFEANGFDPLNTMARIRFMVGNLEGRDLWDIGCGPCRALRFFNPKSYHPIDAEERWIDVMPASARKDFHVATIWRAEQILPAAQCDVVLCNEVLFHICDWNSAFHALWKMTQRTLIVSFYWEPGRIPFLTRHRGAQSVIVEDKGTGHQWYATNNIVPQWMIKRFIAKKLQPHPVSVQYHWSKVPSWGGYGIGYAVIEKEK